LRLHLTDALVQSVSLEKVLASLGGICELNVIVFWCVKELFVVMVAIIIVLGLLYVKIRVPAELSKDVSIGRNFRVFWDASSLDFVILIRV